METLHPVVDFLTENWLTLSTTLLTFVWVYLEYRASVWLWPVGIILPIPWIVISWETHFYGNVALNIYYFITSIIGWVMWLRKKEDKKELPITHIGFRPLLLSLSVAVSIALPVYWGLRQESILPWADVLSSVTSVVGMIWLARKWREHWICWVIANAASCIVFFYDGNYISAMAFLVNLFMSVLGYRHWGKLMRSAS